MPTTAPRAYYSTQLKRQSRSRYKQRQARVSVTRVFKPEEAVFVASSPEELKKLMRDFPGRKITVDFQYSQTTLFNTRDFIDV